jgi:uncharacterized protein YndB with AHSA1/START domain
MTSLTLVRRIKARPSIVFDALTTADGLAGWFGPDEGPVLVAENRSAGWWPLPGTLPHARWQRA